VVDGTSISGIVTWSDIQKAPVLMLGYALIAELELMMNRAIGAMYGGSDGWIQVLDDDDQKFINGRRKRLKKENLVLPSIELADFVHKAKVIRTRYLAQFDFDRDIEQLRKLRNDVAHVHPVVKSDADLHDFVGRLETAKAWTGALSAAGFASI
jgi:hypothetical protein